MDERTQNTMDFLYGRPDLFDRITKDGTGGRVGWAERRPVGYDSRVCLPWGEVKGRYWYPWKEGQGSTWDTISAWHHAAQTGAPGPSPQQYEESKRQLGIE